MSLSIAKLAQSRLLTSTLYFAGSLHRLLLSLVSCGLLWPREGEDGASVTLDYLARAS